MKNMMMVTGVCLTLLIGATVSQAQDKYPSRGIELVIGWAPGGPADLAGRIFANELTKALKVPVTPVNKPGASGTIGATYTFKAKKDGYTLMAGSLGWLLGSITLEGIVYDPLNDFVPITRIANSPHGLFVKSDSPFKTFEDFIEKAKKNPRLPSLPGAIARFPKTNLDPSMVNPRRLTIAVPNQLTISFGQPRGKNQLRKVSL